jgi:hypothetical protein
MTKESSKVGRKKIHLKKGDLTKILERRMAKWEMG